MIKVLLLFVLSFVGAFLGQWLYWRFIAPWNDKRWRKEWEKGEHKK